MSMPWDARIAIVAILATLIMMALVMVEAWRPPVIVEIHDLELFKKEKCVGGDPIDQHICKQMVRLMEELK